MLFLVRSFKFTNKKVTAWVDSKLQGNIDYDHRMPITNIIRLNKIEARVFFTFELKILPDICHIKFRGNCILYSILLSNLLEILGSKEGSKLRKNNSNVFKTINKLLLRRCIDYAKEIGEEKNIRFPNYDHFLEYYDIDKIIFKKKDNKPILNLKDGKLIKK
ncbi:hypothetical protein LCGC14_1016720 [marine sediment metagenome]|uniref:Uncharacterized protein n=1 Tax=marine sediment metagenome TaxID=412755 RepID=A0A0F9NKA9_9ZZZZ